MAKGLARCQRLAGDGKRDVFEQLPEGFEGDYPGIVKQIRDIAGVPEVDKQGIPTGKWVKEPVNADLRTTA